MESDLQRAVEQLASMINQFFTVTRTESVSETRPDQILLYDMRRQSFVVLSVGKEDGEPPASKAAIEKMPTVEMKSKEEIEKMCETAGAECVICMEDWGVGDVVKEMPCQHKFHGCCVEKWLKIHATCPVCRSKMEEENKNEEKEEESEDETEHVEIRRVFVAFGGET